MLAPPEDSAPKGPIAFAAAALTALLAATAVAQAPIVTTVLNNGSTATHYDMVILGDGYQAQEQAHFDQDVNAFLAGLFQKAPYSMLSAYFNVHTVFRASQDSGATQPDVTPPILRNTAYGASYNTGGTARCLYITNTSQALADAALAPANESRVLVMVNDTRYGGCASTFAVSYNGASMVEVQSHELGHSIASLADEYDYPNGNYTGAEPSRVNITANAVGQKWSYWWGVEGVGAFQGAGYYLTGLWRPRNDCLMRNLGVTLCPICREQITRTVNSIADPIQSPQPAAATVALTQPQTQTFSFTNMVPAANNPLITWSLDGTPIANATGTSFLFASNSVAVGVHTLTLGVLDRTTEVRSDPAQTLLHQQAWTVTVTGGNTANLRLATLQTTTLFPAAGTDLDSTITVINDGPATANNFDVEFFLSPNVTLETTDVYLGGTTLASLAAGAQQTITYRGHLPMWLQSGTWFLIAVVDRRDVVPELIQNDNQLATVLLSGPGGCTPTLEYRDDLLYPRDSGAISLASGGSLRPTVAAHCAPAGTLYAIAWSCSGTQPGTTLAPGVTVPLNYDFCTQQVLDNFNGGVFQGFLGVLDARGVGRATLTVPPGLPFGALPGNLGAALLDPTGSFFAATNAVVMNLQ